MKDKNQKGFTLIEILAVVLIIGILLSLIVEGLVRYQNRGKEEYYNSLTDQIELAAKTYYSNNPEELPRGQFEGNVAIYNTQIPLQDLVNQNYLINDIVDADGNTCEVDNNNGYIKVSNINGVYTYNVCVVCNGKVLGGTSGTCQIGNVDNDTPYCIPFVSDAEDGSGFKKITLQTNGDITHAPLSKDPNGYYIAKEPGNYVFEVTKNGITKDCFATVMMGDNNPPTCRIVSRTDDTDTKVTFEFSDNMSLSYAISNDTGEKKQYSCNTGTNTSKKQETFTFSRSADKSYTVQAYDCAGNKVDCETVNVTKYTEPSAPSGDTTTCVQRTKPSDYCSGTTRYTYVCENGTWVKSKVGYSSWCDDEEEVCNNTTSCSGYTLVTKDCNGRTVSSTANSSECGYKRVCVPGAEEDRCDDLGYYYICNSDGTKLTRYSSMCGETNPDTGCFLKGTKVLTKNGYVDIDKIKVGDYVLSYNEETKEQEYSRVSRLFVHKNNIEQLFELTINNKVLKVASSHNFYVKKHNSTNWTWEFARNLEIGDVVLDNFNVEQEITYIKHYQNYNTVYNLYVDNNHNYYVGDGYLVNSYIGNSNDDYAEIIDNYINKKQNFLNIK